MYVGRIVAVGMTSQPFVAYRVSSRSFPNRIARIVGASVAIEPLDPEDLKRNPYIAYNCIRVSEQGVVVSNGSHTDGIWEKLEAGVEPESAIRSVLLEMGYERDELNTPRIAGVIADSTGYLGIVRVDGVETSRFPLRPESCRIICTYELDHLEDKYYPFYGQTAQDVAKYVMEGGVFAEFEKPVCAASWMQEFVVFNPHHTRT